MRLIGYYQGTDALLLSKIPPTGIHKLPYIFWCRLKAGLLDKIIDEYQVDHLVLLKDLRQWGTQKPIHVVPDRLAHVRSYGKRAHVGFNVLYYWPGDKDNSKLWRWIYGYDIYLSVRNILGDSVKWVVVDGKQDMSEVFPEIDFYLRPNRHDGASRLRRECEIQGIPYYWTQQNPKVSDAVEAIKRAISKQIQCERG